MHDGTNQNVHSYMCNSGQQLVLGLSEELITPNRQKSSHTQSRFQQCAKLPLTSDATTLKVQTDFQDTHITITITNLPVKKTYKDTQDNHVIKEQCAILPNI